MQVYKLKVVCILNGSNSNGSTHSDGLRDGWGTPRNQPQLVSVCENNRNRFDGDEPPQAA
jgi:hypothetical protein